MRLMYPGKLEKLQAQLAAAEEAQKTASPQRAKGIGARIAALKRHIRWLESRSTDSPSPVPGLLDRESASV